MHSKQRDIKSLKRSVTRDMTEAAIKSLHEKKLSSNFGEFYQDFKEDPIPTLS